MSDKEYNGWTNYETWCVALWLDNEQSTQEYWKERAADCYERSGVDKLFTREENATFKLCKIMQEETEEHNPMAGIGDMYADMLNASLSMVNWYEIAKHRIDDLIQEKGEL